MSLFTDYRYSDIVLCEDILEIVELDFHSIYIVETIQEQSLNEDYMKDNNAEWGVDVNSIKCSGISFAESNLLNYYRDV